ncbi:hypothetical protein FRC20_002764 [Serendipita sp. 405]|nr:hypothetical protein FRC15_005433 [Serendipita sp. 397]KAG8847397.1 hypothetical protein FRC20_002764 [Serendipita sp. 405]
MAKSTRSKTKRSFRRAKRDDSVYAATHAARLERLSKKLGEIAQINEEDLESGTQGWPFFALLGLVDPDDLGFHQSSPCTRRVTPELTEQESNPWLSSLSPFAWQQLCDSRLMEPLG